MKAILMMLAIPVILSTNCMHGMDIYTLLETAKQRQLNQPQQKAHDELFRYGNDIIKDNIRQMNDMAVLNLKTALANRTIAVIPQGASPLYHEAARMHNASLQK